MRSEGSANFKKTVKSCKNMKDIRTKCGTLKDVADSLKQPINLLQSILNCLELKEKTFQIFEKASQKEIEDYWDILLKKDASLTREHSTQKSIEKLAGLQNFISHCCHFQKYFLTIKKCGSEHCLVCLPVKMSSAIFAGEPCDCNFYFLSVLLRLGMYSTSTQCLVIFGVLCICSTLCPYTISRHCISCSFIMYLHLFIFRVFTCSNYLISCIYIFKLIIKIKIEIKLNL